MERQRREKLKARGWRVGGAEEFLGLTREEAEFVELKVSLGASLRETRRRRGWTQARLAKTIRSSQSRVAKMEAADATVSLDLLVRTLLVLGVSRREVARAIGAQAA